jgi:hypothetical protein
MFFADGSGEKSEGKRAVLGPVFRLESGKTAGFRGKKRIFPVIFRGQILRCGIFRAVYFSSDIDFKRVKNNLQGFKGYLYPHGV